MTGYRIGWTRFGRDSILTSQLTKMQEPIVSCGTSFAQYAAEAALRGPQDCVVEMNRQYKRRRDVALQILCSRGRKSDYIPGGAFYLPVDISKSGNDDDDHDDADDDDDNTGNYVDGDDDLNMVFR